MGSCCAATVPRGPRSQLRRRRDRPQSDTGADRTRSDTIAGRVAGRLGHWVARTMRGKDSHGTRLRRRLRNHPRSDAGRTTTRDRGLSGEPKPCPHLMKIDLPHTLADVTATWLASALSHHGQAVEVADLTLEQIGTGQAGSTYRARPSYRDPTPELPETLVIKLPAEEVSLRAGLALGNRSEVAFYGKIAAAVKAPVPQCFYHDINDAGTEFVLVLSDLEPAIQGDQIGGCSHAQARNVVTALAGLHGPTWCEPAWLELPEFSMPKPGDDVAAHMMADAAQSALGIVLDRLGQLLSTADHDTLRASMDLVAPWLHGPPRYSLMHGDFRADNIMFHPTTDAVTIVDWQTISVGLPGRDLAYFTASSLT